MPSCRECVFAEWSIDEQKGCSLDRLRKFRANGVNVEFKHDRDGSHYIVDGYCNAYRPEKWAQQTLFNRIAEEMRFKATYIVYVDENANGADIIATITSIKKTDKDPLAVWVCWGVSCNLSLRDLVKNALENLDCPWHINTVTDAELGMSLAVSQAMLKTKSNYVCVIQAGTQLAPNFAQSIDRALNHELQNVVFATAPCITLFHTNLYRIAGADHTALFGPISAYLKDNNLPEVDLEALCNQSSLV